MPHLPTGFEYYSGQKLWVDYVKPFVDEWHLDNYGTAYGIINPGKDFKVVIEGHADEISWFVNYIDDDGFINVIRNGGSDHTIAPSKTGKYPYEKWHCKRCFLAGRPFIQERVKIWICPLHWTKSSSMWELKTKMKFSLWVFTWGGVITYPDELEVLNEKYYVGRALDNRMGGFCIAQVARLLKENKQALPFSLYVVNAVQEEIGLRGAQMIADNIKTKCGYSHRCLPRHRYTFSR